MIKAVIFDLDDTLISENEYIKSGFNVVAKYIHQQYGKEQKDIYKELIQLYKNDSKNVFNRWFDKNKIKYKDVEIKEIINIYRCHKPNIKFYNDVIPTIKELKKRKIKIGIITDGYIQTQKAKLEAINAKDLFDEIIITDELGKEFWKPHPKAFELIKKKMGVGFEEMIYIGDNPEKDFYIGSIYPINCIRICRNDSIYKNNNYKNGTKEKYKIENLEEIKNKIKILNTN